MGGSVNADREGHWLEGRINAANLLESQRIWNLIFISHHFPIANDQYTPIDWHLDFKSGYRWSEKTWYKYVKHGHQLGVDIKVPWELSCMQHLIQFALAYAMATADQPGFALPDIYLREFQDQILDFVATNPPHFGVNWTCTIEVAIRVVNWLVAYDLFTKQGASFEETFFLVFSRSVYEHGRHIISNLEWSKEFRGNHYLSDIVGLLFVASYLPLTQETDAWLAFAIQELVKEVGRQFTSDGANFEASTSYHRLSAEMVIYATSLVMGLPPEKQEALQNYDYRLHKMNPSLNPAPLALYPLSNSDHLTPFPSWYIERLEKMAEFTMHITKPNGHIPQIGDNDSSRFLKLQPVYRRMTVAEAKTRYANLEGYTDLPDDAEYWDEDHLDHRHLVAAINGLFDRDDFATFTGDGWLETELIRHIARGNRPASYQRQGEMATAEQLRIGTKKDWTRYQPAPIKGEVKVNTQRHVLKIPIQGGNLYEGRKLYVYPDFGLYIYRSRRLYLLIRCGSVGQNGKGGHDHNDQLSIELNVDGEEWISDPGTYLYTPLPELRNEYRSVKAHFSPQVEGQEPGQLDQGIFRIKNAVRGECKYFQENGFVGVHQGYGKSIYRCIILFPNKITIIDTWIGGGILLKSHKLPNVCTRNISFSSATNPKITTYWSPSYGKKLRNSQS